MDEWLPREPDEYQAPFSIPSTVHMQLTVNKLSSNQLLVSCYNNQYKYFFLKMNLQLSVIMSIAENGSTSCLKIYYLSRLIIKLYSVYIKYRIYLLLLNDSTFNWKFLIHVYSYFFSLVFWHQSYSWMTLNEKKMGHQQFLDGWMRKIKWLTSVKNCPPKGKYGPTCRFFSLQSFRT